MDRLDVLLVNARDKMGCSGLRNLRDLAQMRQDTLEKRLGSTQHKQTVRNILSIYTAWLWEKAYSIPTHEFSSVMEKWCRFLWEIGCTRDMALHAWKTAATTSVIMPMGFDAPVGTMHVGINSFIVDRFSTAPRNKRKLAAMEDDGKREGHSTQVSRTQAPSSSSSSKKQKAVHFGQTFSAQSNSQNIPDARRESHYSSPRSKDPNVYPWEYAVRREREEEASWKRDGFRFDFDPSPRRPTGGSSHWSPDRDVATTRSRRAEKIWSRRPEKNMPPRDQRPQTPIKVEDRSATPPPRVRLAEVMPEPQATQRQTQSWQINNVQSQLKQQARAPIAPPKLARTSTALDNSGWGAYAERSSGPQFGTLAFGNTKASYHSFGNWRENESGRLSPWEEASKHFRNTALLITAGQDEHTDGRVNIAPTEVRQAGLKANEPAVELDNQLPLRPSTVLPAGGNKPLSHFGAPQGVCKPKYGERNMPLQPLGPSSSNLATSTQREHQIAPAGLGIQVAPFPKMHASPLPQQPHVLERIGGEKPVVGYHPGVTRFFARRTNVRIHHTSREIALDTWGDFSQLKPLREYWTWEEYDPSNPIVWDMTTRMERRRPGA